MHPTPPPPGLYVPMVLFFKADETIDLEAQAAHTLRLAHSGIAGLVVHGSNGEATHLLHDEKTAVLKHVRSTLDSAGFTNVIIIAGCSANSVRETVLYTQESKAAGAAYALTLPPSYWAAAMTEPVITKFYTEVAAQSPLPVLIYNFPATTAGIDLSSTFIAKLVHASPNIVGVKLSCGSVAKVARLAAEFEPSRFGVMAGNSGFLMPTLACGGTGAIAAFANVLPKVCIELIRLWEKGDLVGARKLQGRIALGDAQIVGLGMSGVKGTVSGIFGYGSSKARAPLLEKEVNVAEFGENFKGLRQMEEGLADVK